MRAGFRVEAGFGDTEAFDGAAGDEVLGDDFIGIFRLDAAVPDGIGVDDNGGAVFALVEAAGFVDADTTGKAGLTGELREAGVERALAVSGTGWTGRIGRADVMADEDVAFE